MTHLSPTAEPQAAAPRPADVAGAPQQALVPGEAALTQVTGAVSHRRQC